MSNDGDLISSAYDGSRQQIGQTEEQGEHSSPLTAVSGQYFSAGDAAADTTKAWRSRKQVFHQAEKL